MRFSARLRGLVDRVTDPRLEGRAGNASITNDSKPTTTIATAGPHECPRLHLLGLPQELRDLAYEQVFHCSSELTNSRALEPLLVCHQLYHEAHDIAWSNTTFNLALTSFFCMSDLPLRDVTRHGLYCVRLTWLHLVVFPRCPPRIRTLRSYNVPHTEDTYASLLAQCSTLHGYVGRFEVPSDVLDTAMSLQAQGMLSYHWHSDERGWVSAPILERIEEGSMGESHYQFTITSRSSTEEQRMKVVVNFFPYE